MANAARGRDEINTNGNMRDVVYLRCLKAFTLSGGFPVECEEYEDYNDKEKCGRCVRLGGKPAKM